MTQGDDAMKQGQGPMAPISPPRAKVGTGRESDGFETRAMRKPPLTANVYVDFLQRHKYEALT